MSQKKRTNRIKFHHTPLHKQREPHALSFLSQRSSFWIATFSLFAFVVGNMVGQHGWYVFWKSVLGNEDYSMIAYTGTVSPIEYVPNYREWAKYGGDPHEHTYRQIPSNVLVPLPTYRSSLQHRHMELSRIGQVYSVGHMGSYKSGGDGDGAHPGIDIRVPIGTPVRSIANGVVESVNSGGGFGNVIVVRHPNVPDPERPTETTTLFSVYAHLSAMYVSKGDTLAKGDRIALSGNTGMTSGPHLHFQIDREDAPWHPYWPFTSREAANAGLNTYEAVNAGLHRWRGYKYTINPMEYVQADYRPVTLVASARETRSSTPEKPEVNSVTTATREVRYSRYSNNRQERIKSRAEARAQRRLTRRRTARGQTVPSPQPTIVTREEVVSADPTVVTPPPVQSTPEPLPEGYTVEIDHDGSFSGREWEVIRFTLKDAEGNKVSKFEETLYLRTAYGEAEFRPAVLNQRDFKDGEATVKMLPRGRRTVVVQVMPLETISKPLMYRR